MLSLLALSVIASSPAQKPPAPPELHRQAPVPMRPFDKYPWNRPYPVAKHWLLSDRK